MKLETKWDTIKPQVGRELRKNKACRRLSPTLADASSLCLGASWVTEKAGGVEN